MLSPEQIQREEAPDVDLEVGEDDEPAEAVEERVENEEEEEALLIRGDRAVRGVIGEQGDLAGRLHPDVPAPLIGPLNQDGDTDGGTLTDLVPGSAP